MEIGTCESCGTEEIEINDEGLCTTCAEPEGEETHDEEEAVAEEEG